MRLGNLWRRRAAPAMVPMVVLLLLAMAGSAGAATSDEQRMLDLSNQLRASVGARALVLDDALSVTARRWASTVAAAGRISHNPDLPQVTSGPTAIAENVVVGPSLQMAHDALVASHGHYLNLVNPTVSRVGIGVAWAGGMVYVVEDFLVVRGAPAPPATPAPTTSSPPTAIGPPTTTGPSTSARPSTTPGTFAAGPGGPTTAPATMVAPAVAQPAGVTGASSVAGAGPSDWLTLSFDVLRSWDGTSGPRGPSR